MTKRDLARRGKATMSTFTDKLMARAISYDQGGPSASHTAALLREAATEIEWLENEIRTLRKVVALCKEFST
jgi:HAMP domain-containing protein